jgi:hypothetical protein
MAWGYLRFSDDGTKLYIINEKKVKIGEYDVNKYL